MAANLFLSPTTSHTTAHFISQIQHIKQSDALAPISILLPSAGVIQDISTQLEDTFGIQMYAFYRLGQALLDEAGVPLREIPDIAVRRLIKQILGEMSLAGRLTTFAAVWQKPGLVEVILDWVHEMKSLGVSPQQYTVHAKNTGNNKDQQLAEFYARYQTFMLERNYSDADGLLWVTAETLEADPNLFRENSSTFVLGFDQFTPVQIRILQQLSERLSAFNIYLLWDEQRAEDSLVLSRFKRTRDQLHANISLDVSFLADDPVPADLLAHVHRNIFEPAEAHPADIQRIQLIEAPSRAAEVRHMLQAVKRLLIKGVPAAEIAILAPNTSTYLPTIRAAASEYGVPIACEQPLLANPAIAAFANLLQIPGNFGWHETFAALRSPYIHQTSLSTEQIVLLDQLSRQRPVIAGRDQWQFAVLPITSEQDDPVRPTLVATLPAEVLSALRNGLNAFFDLLSPPEAAGYREFIWWLQTALVGCFPETNSAAANEEAEDQTPDSTPTLDLLECCQEGSRDVQALGQLMGALKRLLVSAETVPSDAEVSWETFRDDITGMLADMTIRPDPLQVMVRFDQLGEGRARCVDHLFVLGLSEGEFPTPPPADAFYTARERESHPLLPIHYAPADSASLWWQIIGNVRKQLVLLRPYIDRNGAPWQSSPYWDAVLECVTDLATERIPIAVQPKPENSASETELLVALTQMSVQDPPAVCREKWKYTLDAQRILRQRQSYQPAGRFEGVFESSSLKNELLVRHGNQFIWSASRLNRYSTCPFSFFAEYILKLEPYQDPEEGLDAMQRGSLLHAILEHLYTQLAVTATAPTNSNLEAILQQLDQSCAALFPVAPQNHAFRPGALWDYEQEELRRLLRVLVSWDCEQNSADIKYSPYLQEARFGIGHNGPPALKIAGNNMHFLLCGVIDRLDRDPDGNVRVIDYKSGSVTYSKPDLEKGLALQTALYALAAEEYWAGEHARVAESHYWHIPNRKSSGSLYFQAGVRENELTREIIRHAAGNITQIQAGIFPSAPAKRYQGGRDCSSRCNFGALCRVSRQSIAKAWRGESL